MPPSSARSGETPWLAFLPWAAALAVGVWLRGQQWAEQVLIDDEWHLVHRLVLSTPREMFFDFGYSDYAIPLGLLYSALGEVMPLSEAVLRMPMLLAGIATLVLLPALVLCRVGLPSTTLFAGLIAISPLLIVYSRLARPYALVLPLVWIAVFAILRFSARKDGGGALAVGAVVASVLAAWMHLAASCFVAAAFVVAAWPLLRRVRVEGAAPVIRLGLLAMAIGVLCCALILPPLLANPQAMALKSGIDSPGIDTLVSAWFAWVGTTSNVVAIVAGVLALAGLVPLLRDVPETRALALGAVLALLLVVLTQPASSHYGVVLARYLLPALPLALLAMACGAWMLVRRVAPEARGPAVAFAGVLGVLACAGLAVTSPVREWWERPNRHALHMQYYFDFREGRNLFGPHLDGIPDSAFWRTLSRQRPGSLRVAVAPFYFESFNWNAPEWERESGQAVIPAYLTGFCVDWRWGEVPARLPFAFRNAVHLSDAREMAARGIDLVVWQRPYVRGTDLMGEDTQHCEARLREQFGKPWYEDDAVMVFAMRKLEAGKGL